jgi:hypothetical protein
MDGNSLSSTSRPPNLSALFSVISVVRCGACNGDLSAYKESYFPVLPLSVLSTLFILSLCYRKHESFDVTDRPESSRAFSRFSYESRSVWSFFLLVLAAVCTDGRSRWPRGIRFGSAAVRLLRLRIRMPPGARFLSIIIAVCCQTSLRRADHSSRGVLPSVACCCVWSRNLKNQEAMADVGSHRHREEKMYCW